MSTILDENGIEHSVHNGRKYYNKTYAARYVGMTDTGLRRKIKKIEAESGITIPFKTLPFSAQKKYIDKRILDVFRMSVNVGEEKRWYDELKFVVDTVRNEDG